MFREKCETQSKYYAIVMTYHPAVFNIKTHFVFNIKSQGGATLDDDYRLVFRRVYILATFLTCNVFPYKCTNK